VSGTMISHRALWAGRILSALVAVALVADGTIQFFAPAQIASMLQETGFAMDLTRVVGPIILACAILYAIPTTAVLGAILVTGFLGGAICAHVRIGELGSPPEFISLLLGAATWGGLYLRDPRIRALLPLIH
jgi:hypothetical protein